MGVKDLPKLLKEVGVAIDISDEKFTSRIWGIDMSILLHQYLIIKDTAAIFTANENIRLTESIKFITLKIKRLSDKCRGIVCVFDGLAYPPKVDTNTGRSSKRDAALTENRQLLKEALELFPTNPKESLKQRQNIMKTKTNIAVYRRANFTADVILELKKLPNVKVIHAPFEADHQLYHLYKCKLIDGVYTKDSDLYILGVRTLLIMCDGNKRHATDDRSILKRDTFVNLEDKDDEKNFIEKHVFGDNKYFLRYDEITRSLLVDLAYDEGLKMWAIMQGCDYLVLNTVRDRMNEYLLCLLADAKNNESNQEESDNPYLQWFINFADKPVHGLQNAGERDAFMDKINVTYNRLIHAPVFHIIPKVYIVHVVHTVHIVYLARTVHTLHLYSSQSSCT